MKRCIPFLSLVATSMLLVSAYADSNSQPPENFFYCTQSVTIDYVNPADEHDPNAPKGTITKATPANTPSSLLPIDYSNVSMRNVSFNPDTPPKSGTYTCNFTDARVSGDIPVCDYVCGTDGGIIYLGYYYFDGGYVPDPNVGYGWQNRSLGLECDKNSAAACPFIQQAPSSAKQVSKK